MPEGITTTLGSAKVWVFAVSGLGAVCGLAAAGPMGKLQAFIYVAIGSYLGGSTAQIAGWFFDMPPDITVYLSAILGVPGVGLSYSIVQALRDPVATFKRIRGDSNE